MNYKVIDDYLSNMCKEQCEVDMLDPHTLNDVSSEPENANVNYFFGYI